jgi:hypothetical protein
MLFVNAISLSPDVKDWLANSRHPRVLHVFERACNLINEHRELISIVTPQIGNGPFNLVVKDNISFSDTLNLESPISISPAQLILGDLTIDTVDAKLWNPRPGWESLHSRRDNIFDQLTLLPMSNYYPLLPQSLVSTLSSALVNADISSALKVTSQLAGLGMGLTPSGDDLIMGAIYAAWIIHPFEIASTLVQEVADTAAPLTTSLSAAWLTSAGKGEVGILWHKFFDALISKDRMRIEETMENILAVGETSGADALAGFTGVFVSWMDKAGSSRE